MTGMTETISKGNEYKHIIKVMALMTRAMDFLEQAVEHSNGQ